MNTTDLSSVTWRKSSHSNADYSCVEVADLHNGHRAIRDSKNPTGPEIHLPAPAWSAFIAAVQPGA